MDGGGGARRETRPRWERSSWQALTVPASSPRAACSGRAAGTSAHCPRMLQRDVPSNNIDYSRLMPRWPVQRSTRGWVPPVPDGELRRRSLDGSLIRGASESDTRLGSRPAHDWIHQTIGGLGPPGHFQTPSSAPPREIEVGLEKHFRGILLDPGRGLWHGLGRERRGERASRHGSPAKSQDACTKAESCRRR